MGAAILWSMQMSSTSTPRFLDVLEAELSRQFFLFGERPSIADFGLCGMLSQFVIDPTPSRILRGRGRAIAPMNPLSRRSLGHDGAASCGTANRPCDALVELAGRTLLPMIVAVSEAVTRGQRPASYEVESMRVTGFARPDVARCWLWLKQMFAELSYGDRQLLRRRSRKRFSKALAFVPGEAEGTCHPSSMT